MNQEMVFQNQPESEAFHASAWRIHDRGGCVVRLLFQAFSWTRGAFVHAFPNSWGGAPHELRNGAPKHPTSGQGVI